MNWEIVDVHGESMGVFTDGTEAWMAFGGVDDGVRLVQYTDTSVIVGEWEATSMGVSYLMDDVVFEVWDAWDMCALITMKPNLLGTFPTYALAKLFIGGLVDTYDQHELFYDVFKVEGDKKVEVGL